MFAKAVHLISVIFVLQIFRNPFFANHRKNLILVRNGAANVFRASPKRIQQDAKFSLIPINLCYEMNMRIVFVKAFMGIYETRQPMFRSV